MDPLVTKAAVCGAAAAVTVAAVLIAGTLAKLGHAWWGFG